MTLHRRPVGRGRWVAAGAAVVVLLGCVLPWYRVGGDPGIPAISGNAFEGTGILVFLAGLAMLALVTLPFALGDAASAVDPWWAYAVVVVVAVIGFAIRLFETFGWPDGLTPILPDRGPGTWVTLIGLVAMAVAIAELYGRRD